MASEVGKLQKKNELFNFVLILSNAVHRNLIAGAILRKFGHQLDHDELMFIVIHVDGPTAEKAAERLFTESICPEVLGVVSKFFPQYEEETWVKIKKIFPHGKDDPGRETFLSYCHRLRSEVRINMFYERNRHLELPAPAKK